MNLKKQVNTWLCQHFKPSDRDDVTIGDIVLRVLGEIYQLTEYIIIIFFVWLFGGTLWIIEYGITRNVPQTDISIYFVIKCLFLGWELALFDIAKFILMVISYLWLKVMIASVVVYHVIQICKIKVAKCEFKERENQEVK